MSVQRETSSVGTLESRKVVIAERLPNKLLASLPSEDYQRIAPHLQRVPMRLKQILYKQDAPLDGVYFPGGGACALVKTTEDSQTIEIAVVGSEGATVFFGLSHAPCDVIVQMAGSYADVMPVPVLTREIERRGALYSRIVRYSQALMVQLTQSTSCSCLHSAEQRCARWLLATQDRAGRDEFRFTHEFAARMLGLRRPTVTIVVHRLKAGGLIEHHRGRVTILDRVGLEGVSCECYRVLRNTFKRLLPDATVGETHAVQ